MSFRSHKMNQPQPRLRRFGISTPRHVRDYLAALEGIKLAFATETVTRIKKKRLLSEAAERLEATARRITDEELWKAESLLSRKMTAFAKTIHYTLPAEFAKDIQRVERPNVATFNGYRHRTGRPLPRTSHGTKPAFKAPAGRGGGRLGGAGGGGFGGDGDLGGGGGSGVSIVGFKPGSPQRTVFDKVNAGFVEILIHGSPEFVEQMRHADLSIRFVADDDSEKVVRKVSAKPLATPGGQEAHFNERCKWICECLEEFRKGQRNAYKYEFEHGITNHLALPTVEFIVGWIARKHDASITRREIDRVLLDALGTTPSAYAHARNEGRQRYEAAHQAELSRRPLKPGEREIGTREFPITDRADRINPRLVMYWTKLPTDLNFVLLEHKPSVPKLDAAKYLAALKVNLQMT